MTTRLMTLLFVLVSALATAQTPAATAPDVSSAALQQADGKEIPCRPDTCPCPPVQYRPFDLGVHGINFAVRTTVTIGCDRYLLVYDPGLRAAALVDVRTGLAEVALGFSADVPDDERGPITFDAVQVLDGTTLLWWHRGAAWSHVWPFGRLPVRDLSSFIVVDPKTRQRTALFRWR